MSSKKSLRVLLADDHPIVREGVKTFLEKAGKCRVIGEAGDGVEAVEKTIKLKPDIVLLDINMPEIDGLEAARRIADLAPGTHIVALTVHDDPAYLRKLMAVGVKGYILKDSPPQELASALDAVASGGTWYSGRVVQAMAGAPDSAKQTEKAVVKLTLRERGVLKSIAEGLSNKDVARQLNLSVRTVESHRDHIMKKLDIHNTAGLTRYAMEHGIVE